MWRKRVRFSAVEAVQVIRCGTSGVSAPDYEDIFEFRSILLDGLLACFDTGVLGRQPIGISTESRADASAFEVDSGRRWRDVWK